MTPQPVAYLCADPGIPPDGSKGASVHFRAMAAAFAHIGTQLDVFMARTGEVDGLAPHRTWLVPTPRARGVAGEVMQLAHSRELLAAMTAAGPHCAVYERMSLFSAAGLAHSRALGVPYIVEVNAPLWLEAAQFRSLELAATARSLCIDTLRGADAVFAVSEALATMLAEEGISREQIHVLGNGADLAAFSEATRAERPFAFRDKPVLMFAGSLKPWHGIKFLLQAFAALRKRRPCGLWVIGDGPERQTVEAAADAAPDDIICEGAVPHERMAQLLAASDIVCAPYPSSAPHYFSPLKVVEGIAAGKPLLASRVPCVLGEVRGKELPGLYTADDIEAFVAAAERVLADPDAATASDLIADLDWTVKAKTVQPWLHPTAAGSD